MPSETKPIFPLVNRLTRLIEGSRCVAGEESVVELALWEALNNAVVHGNRLDAHKLVRLLPLCLEGGDIPRRQGPRPRIRPECGSQSPES
jgi:hypothetical protein